MTEIFVNKNYFTQLTITIATIKAEIPYIKLGVVGSRTRNTAKDKTLVYWILDQFDPQEIVSGECKDGADAFAKQYANEHPSIKYVPFPPQYPPYRTSYQEAVTILYARNRKIAEYANVLVALENQGCIDKGGTANTIKHWLKMKTKETLIRVE